MDKFTLTPGVVQVFQIDADSFMDRLAECVTERLLAKMEALTKPDEDKLLSPKETCDLFQPKVSVATLAAWERQGFLTKHRIGARTYYKKSQVLEAAKSLRKYQRQSIHPASNV